MSILIESFFNALTAGVLVGCMFALMCMGVGLIYGIMGVVNFSQGDFMMLGMYATLFVTGAALQSILGSYVAPYVAAFIAGAVLFVLAYAVHWTILRQITGTRATGYENSGHNAQLILTLGLSIILSNGGLLFFGSDPRSIHAPASDNFIQVALASNDSVMVFTDQNRLIVSAIALMVCLAVYLFVQKTPIGRGLRAASDNVEAAIYLGINVDSAHRLAFAIGIAVTGIAGGLLATYYTFQPYVGAEFVIIMYAGVVLGGMGSVGGAFAGGMLIAIIQQMSSLFLPTQLQTTTIFVVFILTLLIRPQGLFGRSTDRA